MVGDNTSDEKEQLSQDVVASNTFVCTQECGDVPWEIMLRSAVGFDVEEVIFISDVFPVPFCCFLIVQGNPYLPICFSHVKKYAS